jgi:uncharacterized membrane protein HdeD (DUF308 family)
VGLVTDVSTQDPFDTVASVGRHWGWLFFFGIVTVVLGILITVRPVDTVYAFAILFGIWALIAGLFKIVAAIADRGDTGGMRLLGVIFGLLAVLVGLLVLHHQFETVAVVGFLIGLFWVVGGLAELIGAFSVTPAPHRVWQAIAGIIGIVVGILALVYPGLSLAVIALLFGLWLILYGVMQMAVAFTLRAAAKGHDLPDV